METTGKILVLIGAIGIMGFLIWAAFVILKDMWDSREYAWVGFISCLILIGIGLLLAHPQ